jgi:methyl-accepting chemotaxis protein
MESLAWLPQGSSMSEESWRERHRVVRGFLWAEVPVLWLVGIFGPRSLAEGLLLPLTLVAVAGLVELARSSRIKSDLTSLGVVGGSFVAIELSGGQLNAHLYILSAVAVVALYQRWSPLLLTVGAVVVHHLLFGLIVPQRVMSMSSTMAMRPSDGQVAVMVLTHAVAVLIEVGAILLWWHFSEKSERESALLREQVEADRGRQDTERAELAIRESGRERERAEAVARRGAALSREAERIREHARESQEAISELEQQSGMLSSAVNEIAQRCEDAAATARAGQTTTDSAETDVRHLEEAISEIASVNELIGQLAAQTNLLSLNATIEAARAGELGKGFGVVAQEVKSLASETASSAEKVRSVVDDVIRGTSRVAASFRTTNDLVGRIGIAQTSIAASVEQQAAVLAEVSRQTSFAAKAGQDVASALQDLVSVSAEDQ